MWRCANDDDDDGDDDDDLSRRGRMRGSPKDGGSRWRLHRSESSVKASSN